MDQDLVSRAKQGDKDAFTTLVVRHGDRLYSVAFRVLRDTTRAEDAVQQTFLTAWSSAMSSSARSADCRESNERSSRCTTTSDCPAMRSRKPCGRDESSPGAVIRRTSTDS